MAVAARRERTYIVPKKSIGITPFNRETDNIEDKLDEIINEVNEMGEVLWLVYKLTILESISKLSDEQLIEAHNLIKDKDAPTT